MTTSGAVPHRLVFIDVLRLIAAVQMIQGHSIAAVLAPAHRSGALYRDWTFVRGLTSVSFLFSAGFAFALAEASAQSDQARQAGRRRRTRRALRLLMIGYVMHAPLGVLFGAALADTLRAFAVVDVLQCIAVSLLSLELLSRFVASRRARMGLALGLALLVYSLAPASQSLVLSDTGLVLGNYLTARHGSLFPLLPWAGFVWIGFALGVLSLARPTWLVRSLVGSGALLLALGLALATVLPSWPRALSPGYAAVKLGCVLLLAGLLAHALRRVARLPEPLTRLASQTLFLYVSHVVILYADHVGLASLLGPRHSVSFGVLLALALLLLCGAGALALGSLRGRSASGTTAAQSP